MSYIDTRLAQEQRDVLLEEIRNWLPAFLSAASAERLNPLEQVADLLALDPRDLRRVMAVHVLLHPSIQSFIGALPLALRSPATSSHRPRQLTRAISGGVDWAATVRARATGSPTEGGFVTRPAVRLFDVAENRVLAWLLAELSKLAQIASGAAPPQGSSSDWGDTLLRSADRLRTSLRTAWLRGVPRTRPAAKDFAALSSSRQLFYKGLLREASDCFRTYTDDPSANDVAQLLAQRWFEPTRDWQLFELAVLLRLERTFSTTATRLRIRPLGHTRTPFAAFALDDGALVRLWYQTWPEASGPSEQLSAARHYKIATSGSRPDIVIEVARGSEQRAVLLELKATRSGEYLGAGLLQLLAYLRDRPALFSDLPQVAWLVAPSDAPLLSVPAGGRQLWAVGADDVAPAARARVTVLSTTMSAGSAPPN